MIEYDFHYGILVILKHTINKINMNDGLLILHVCYAIVACYLLPKLQCPLYKHSSGPGRIRTLNLFSVREAHWSSSESSSYI